MDVIAKIYKALCEDALIKNAWFFVTWLGTLTSLLLLYELPDLDVFQRKGK